MLTWVTNLKIRNVGLSFAKLEMDLTVYLKVPMKRKFLIFIMKEQKKLGRFAIYCCFVSYLVSEL